MGSRELSRRGLLGAAATAAAAVGLGACAGGGGDASGGGDANGGGGAGGGGGQLDPGQTLRYTTNFLTVGFDPHKTPRYTDNIGMVYVYDRLVHRDGENKLQPGLAEKWETAQDLSTFTLYLRKGLKFGDGTPFDANAVKANLERAKEKDSPTAQQLTAISEVTVKDEHTVVCKLSGPPSTLPASLTELPGMMVNPKAFATPEKAKELNLKADGIGRYRLAKHQPAAHYEFEATPDYWDPKAIGAKKMIVDIQADPQTRLNALMGGQVDIAQSSPVILDPAKQGGFKDLTAPNSNVNVLFMNKAKPVFAKLEARQAIQYAIDRTNMAKAAFEGKGSSTTSLLLDKDPSFAKEAADMYKFDRAKAKELLDRAGGPFSFTCGVLNFPEHKATAEIVKAQLKELGITMEIQAKTAADVTVDFLNGKVDTTMTTWVRRADLSVMLQYYFGSKGVGNPSKQEAPGMDAKLTEADKTIDESKRAKVLSEAVVLSAKDATSVYLTRDQRGVLASGKVAGYQPSSYPPDEFRGVGLSK